jgi:ABC-type transport system involved in multi-copper enzyme maturation permease subunit
MTVLILPAGAGADTAERPRPVPWHRMLWVTWRQQRATFVSVPGVLAVISVFLVVASVQVHSAYGALIATPVNSASRQILKGEFNNGPWALAQALDFLMQVAPALLGIFAGAPLLARELETGTFRFAWTQGLCRDRWVIAKLALLGAFTAVLAGAFGQLFAWFFQPFISEGDASVVNGLVFDTRPVVFGAWALAAFMIAACSGMLLRRTLPAMAVTLGVYLGLWLLTEGILRGLYPVSGFWPSQLFEGAWLVAASVALIAGTVWLARRRAA